MAKLLGPAFRRGQSTAATLRLLSGPGRSSLRIVESIAFSPPALVATVYLGAADRSTRYLGPSTDATRYLGAKALFA